MWQRVAVKFVRYECIEPHQYIDRYDVKPTVAIEVANGTWLSRYIMLLYLPPTCRELCSWGRYSRRYVHMRDWQEGEANLNLHTKSSLPTYRAQGAEKLQCKGRSRDADGGYIWPVSERDDGT